GRMVSAAMNTYGAVGDQDAAATQMIDGGGTWVSHLNRPLNRPPNRLPDGPFRALEVKVTSAKSARSQCAHCCSFGSLS
ncbi:hypothetical protein ABZX99_35125, partial [Streptomyces antibioticus]|uniref:hypothetical protein n=1 Tax=Streptomyces antibioticus TaxID=1890 RepID=UPI0033A4704F